MLGREVIKGKECVLIIDQALDRLWIFSAIFLGKDSDRCPCRSPVWREPDFHQIPLHRWMHGLGNLVENVAGLVHPTALMARFGMNFFERLPEAKSAVAHRQLR